jgi:hypothetical protein
MTTPPTDASAFIARWQGVTASELSTSQSFVIELCELLGVPRPHATPEQDYMFERPVTFAHGNGSTSAGRIDCYRRGAFIWESKKLKPGAAATAANATTKAFDDALLRARSQAEAYARALPASEGRPPFLVVVDVGHVIELYAEFTRSGATYTPFPDPRSHRIRLTDLASAAVRARLAALWTDPLSLDPARISARVTRKVAAELADLARSLEAAGHTPEQVAGFLTRCLFSMFAEDVGLLPQGADGSGSFLALLKTHREQPGTLVNMLRVFWAGMDRGGFNAAIAQDVLRFNGKLFKGANGGGYVLPLNGAQVDGLLRAASANWQEVEPAIFGTLLERALSTTERHALGAHYTPRAYVERLVLPTVMEPLRADWANAQAAAVLLAREAEALEANPPQRKGGTTHDTFDPRQLAKESKALVEHERKVREKWREALREVRRFHHQLCTTRVLDPACGSGNFLYVTLEHLKRLEGEVLNQLRELGEGTDVLADGETVTLKQFLGIELNPRAAAVAELVLWIGWLQWQVRTQGNNSVAEPVIHDYGNIECRDAVLAYDRAEIALDANGKPITRWDGKTVKKHQVTGEDVPDETAQAPQWRYVNPRRAEWPAADFIVGNPPFIGSKRMRSALGDGYVDALQTAWPDVPEAADFVMRWWHKAALQVRAGHAHRFGLITSNSLRQAYVRRAVEPHLLGEDRLSLVYAIPDHPWVDNADGAAVRIAMTVGERGHRPGQLNEVLAEATDDDESEDRVESMVAAVGVIGADLRVGANVAGASTLLANSALCSVGMKTIGAAFQVSQTEAIFLGLGSVVGLDRHIRPYLSGRDFVSSPRGVWVIDMFGLSDEDVRARFPAVFQHLITKVKPERDQNRNAVFRRLWWVIGHPRPQYREAVEGLRRYIATVETAKHRVLAFLPTEVVPDSTLVTFALDDALWLGVLSSQAHVDWALAAGGTLEDRPRYNKTKCFETFPLPAEDTGLTPEIAARIRALAEQLDAHRKARQAAHELVTLTGLYNVLDKLRREQPLSAADKALHEHGLVSVLRTLHDELDAAVLEAYGWSDLGPVPWADEAARSAWTETLLERLVALNAKRAAEEAQGTVRWLRPEFQNPRQAVAEPVPTQDAIEMPEDDEPPATTATAAAKAARQPWPAALPEQMRAVADVLAGHAGTLAEADLAERFTGRGPWKRRLPQILRTLEALGRARCEGERWRA